MSEGAANLRPAARTLIVTAKYREVAGATGESAIRNEIHRFELVADGAVAQISLAQPDLIIERSVLIQRLADEAAEAGAVIDFGCRVDGIGTTPDGVRVLFQDERETQCWRCVPTVVAADGAGSTVAHAAGWPRQPLVPLLQAIVTLPANFPPDLCRIWFIPKDTPYFYWLIPESSGRAALGVIGESSQRLRDRLIAFVREQDLEILGFQGARIPCYVGWIPICRKVGGGAVYVVGDAAGHVKVTTIGGIVDGLWGARGVARSILAGKELPELAALRRELDLHLFIRKILHDWTVQEYAQLVSSLNRRSRNQLGRITRDETPRLLSLLALSQPSLALRALRSIVTGSSFPNHFLNGKGHSTAGPPPSAPQPDPLFVEA